MVIYTAKFSKKKLIAALVILVLIVVAIVWAVPNRDTPQLPASNPVGAKIKTEEDRVAYIESLGYAAASEEVKMKEVIIPKEFDDTYEMYNALQAECGFDLVKYKGKRCSLYTYPITGYEGQEGVMIDLIIYREKVIGGGIYTASLDGFMHGLKAKDS